MVSNHKENMLREEIGRYFKLKEKSIGLPDNYLGGKMRRVKLENGSNAWAFMSSQYVVEAVKNVEAYLAWKEKKLNAKAGAHISNRYRPEIEAINELRPVDADYYQSLIGIIRWMVDLGRVDICVELLILSS